jgi:hypothetical protein
MSKIISGSNSQASQESFVLSVLKEKTNGFYVELGGGWAQKNSNTYLLESKYGWTGVSFENDPIRAYAYNLTRKNKTLAVDARTFDYEKYFIENNYPRHIDYLQMDIHPASSTLEALKAIPLSKYRFSVITYEHNGYKDSFHKSIQEESQRILLDLGYVLVVENVIFQDIAYEDWWIDPRSIAYKDYEMFISNNILHTELFED